MRISLYLVTDQEFSKDFTSDFIQTLNAHLDASIFDVEHTTQPGLLASGLRSRTGCVLVDGTTKKVPSYELRLFSLAHDCTFFSLGWVETHRTSVYYTHPLPEEEAAALLAVVSATGWNELHVLSTQSALGISTKFANGLDQIPPQTRSYTIVGSSSSQAIYNSYAAVGVKRSGNWKTVVIASGDQASAAFMGMVNAKIFRPGCGLILSTQAVWGGVYDDGVIIMTETGLESSQSEGQYEALALVKMLNGMDDSTEELGSFLAAAYPTGRPQPEYTVLNQLGTLNVVGSVIGTELTLLVPFVYPGYLPAVPETAPLILFSADTNFLLPSGEIDLTEYQVLLALPLMIDVVNADTSILPNFEVVMYPLDCGAGFFDYDHHKNCLTTHLNHLGLFKLLTVNADVAVGTIGILRELGVTLPHLGLYYTNDDLYDKSLYPELITITNSDFYLAMVAALYIRAMGWRHITLIKSNETVSVNTFFIYQCEVLGIEIMNPDHYFPQEYTKADFPTYKDLFEEIYWSGSRIIVTTLLHETLMSIAEGLYDVGFRNKDVILCAGLRFDLIMNMLEGQFEEDKVLTILDGGVALTRAEYIGEVGNELKEFVAQYLGDQTDYTCFMIDAMYLGLYGVDMMLHLGKDFEDPLLLNEFIRLQRFEGCTGKLSISSESNERNPIIYSLYNFQVTENGWEQPQVGTYTIGAVIPLEYTEQLYFPGGETETPSDMRDMTNMCKFREGHFNWDSYKWSVGIVSVVIFAATAIGICLCKKFYSYQLKPLSEKIEITFEDSVILVGSLVEAYCLLALGPKFSLHTYILQYIHSSNFERLSEVLTFQGSAYWGTVYLFFGVTCVWVTCILLNLFIQRRAFPDWLKGYIDVLGVKLVPALGNAGYLLVSYVLLSIYMCDQGSRDSIYTTVLRADCNTWCWKNTHFTMVVLISIVGFLYFILNFVVCQFYDNFYYYVVLKTNPTCNTLRRILLSTLLACSVLVKPVAYKSYSIVAFCLTGALVFVISVWKPSNYGRFNHWQRVLHIGVLWSMGCSLGHENTSKIPEWLALTSQLIGFVALAIFGVIWQVKHYPSYLKKTPDTSIPKLFKFMLSNKVAAQDLTIQDLAMRNSEINSGAARNGPGWFIDAPNAKISPKPSRSTCN